MIERPSWTLARTALVVGLALVTPTRAADEVLTVEAATGVMAEIMAIPVSQIPTNMLAEAQGLVIIPNVIKIGFVVGGRFGRGVLLARGNDGRWTLPTFVTLTGGSIGWQAGAQATDVILVMRTRRSVDALLRGQFTLGGDASVAAGPVGRSVEAATDLTLRAEILSYSRSRGLFAGAALNGTVISVDAAAHTAFYGSAPSQLPIQTPLAATQLVDYLNSLSAQRVPAAAPGAAAPSAASSAAPAPQVATPSVESQALRAELAVSATALAARLDDEWKEFFSMPTEIFDAAMPPSLSSLRAAQYRMKMVADDSRYAELTSQPEFKSTSDLLAKYIASLTPAAPPPLNLPPPPR